MKHKHILLLTLLMILSCFNLKAQTIPTYFFGENAWMPDSIGNDNHYNGKLHSNWNNVQQSNVKLMRVGGHDYDFNRLFNLQYLKMVDSIRAKGMEPILQVPYGDGLNPAFNASNAANIVTFINVTHGRNVKYWEIANEPNHSSYTNNRTAAKITTYIKAFSIAMKSVDSTIKIIGPSLTRINVLNPGDGAQKLMDSLTTWTSTSTTNIVGMIPSGNGNASGKPYIDYCDFHMYNYDGSASTYRAWLIGKLTSSSTTSGVNGDSANMGWMKRRCDLINANVLIGRSNYPLKPMITEANICFNPSGSGDTWTGLKGSGFFAGQHWCEMMSLAIYKGIESIQFWSTMEGNGNGYMTNSTTPLKKSTYYHTQQMGKWLTGTHYLGSDSRTTTHTNIKNIKAFGSVDGNHIAVMVLNQDSLSTTSAPYPKRAYSISLNGSYASTDTNRIKLSMGLSKTYRDTIESASTTLLIFDCAGNISQKYQYKQSDSLHPFKSVWAATSPATIAAADAGADKFVNCNCCSGSGTTTIGTAAISGYTYSWSPTSYLSSSTVAQPTVSIPCSLVGNMGLYSYFTYTLTTTYNGVCTATDVVLITAAKTTDCCPPERMYIKNDTDLTEQRNISELLSSMPNPTYEKTTVYYNLKNDVSSAEIRILNIQGKVIEKYNVDCKSSQLEINLEEHPSGIYFYSLVTDGLTVDTKKLVILK